MDVFKFPSVSEKSTSTNDASVSHPFLLTISMLYDCCSTDKTMLYASKNMAPLFSFLSDSDTRYSCLYCTFVSSLMNIRADLVTDNLGTLQFDTLQVAASEGLQESVANADRHFQINRLLNVGMFEYHILEADLPCEPRICIVRLGYGNPLPRVKKQAYLP